MPRRSIFLPSLMGALALALLLWTVWHVRAAIADLIRGDGTRGAVAGWLADLWPVIATAFFVAIVVARIYDVLNGTPVVVGAGLLSVLLVVAMPIVDMVICRAIAAAAAAPADASSAGARVPRRLRARVPARHPHRRDRRRHVAARRAVGSRPVRTGAGEPRRQDRELAARYRHRAAVAYMLWEIVKTAIDRRLAGRGRPAQ